MMGSKTVLLVSTECYDEIASALRSDGRQANANGDREGLILEDYEIAAGGPAYKAGTVEGFDREANTLQVELEDTTAIQGVWLGQPVTIDLRKG